MSKMYTTPLNVLNFKSRNSEFSGYQEVDPILAPFANPESNILYLSQDTARGIISPYNVKYGDEFGIEQVSSTGTTFGQRALRLFTSNPSGYISIGKYVDYDNFVDVITINNLGNVGINNTGPIYALDVKNVIAANSFTGFYGHFNTIEADTIINHNPQPITGCHVDLDYIRTINLTGTNIYVTNLLQTNLLQSVYSNITYLDSNVITGTNIHTDNINSNKIFSNYANLDYIDTNTITGTNLSIENFEIKNLNVINATIQNITGNNLSITSLASINSLTGNNSNFSSSVINGDLYVGGNAYKPYSQMWNISSDIRIKNNIENLDTFDCVKSIDKIKLKKYQFNQDYNYHFNMKSRTHLGVIADELQQTHPNSVRELDYVEISNKSYYNFKTVDLSEQIFELIGSVQYLFNELKTIKNHLNLQ